MPSRAQLAVARSLAARGAVQPQLATVAQFPDQSGRAREGQVLHETYRIDRLIAEGGMGSVYEVEHLRLKQRFAVKILEHQAARNDEAYARFRQEAEIAASLNHSSIVQVFDFNTDEQGNPYMVMELVEGRTLNRLIGGRPMGIREAGRIMEHLCSALDAAHRAGIVHRDLKPSNVMVRRPSSGGCEVKLLDFGISKMKDADNDGMTRDNVVMGTPNYMSPEQARGLASTVDAKTDIFALGAILYEMLVGRRAFDAPSTPELLHAIVYEEPRPLAEARSQVPAAMVQVVERCLKKAPDERYRSVRELSSALSKALSEQAAVPSVEELPSPRRTPLRSVAWGLAWAVSVAAAAVAASVAVSHPGPAVVVHRAPAVGLGTPPPTPLPTVSEAEEKAYPADVATPSALMLMVGPTLYRADPRGLTFWSDPDAVPNIRALPTAAAVTDLSATPEGEILVGQADGTVTRWEGGLEGNPKSHRIGAQEITALAAAGDYLAVGHDEQVQLLNDRTGRVLKRFEGKGEVRGLLIARAPESRLLIIRPRELAVVDLDRRRVISRVVLVADAVGAELLLEPPQGSLELAIDFEQGDWATRRSYRLVEERRGKVRLEPTKTERLPG